MIVVNKIDDVPRERLDHLFAVLRKLNATAKIVPALYGRIELREILNTQRFDFDKASAAPGWMAVLRDEEQPEAAEYGISSFVYRDPAEVDGLLVAGRTGHGDFPSWSLVGRRTAGRVADRPERESRHPRQLRRRVRRPATGACFQRIAVIENEFGEVGVDQDLVINAEEEIFVMNNGCICCTVRGDLIRLLGNLMKRRDKFDYILIETTGMADPGPVAQTFFVDDEIKAKTQLDGLITLVDAKHVHQHWDSDEVQEQIAFADVIMLN